jgi:hypothetical protein
MTLRSQSVESLPPIRPPIRAEITAILAALWPADSNRVVAAFDPFVITLLHPVGPVVAPVLSPRHPGGLR